MNYPPTRTVDASDTYFGKTYNDPYRWLENIADSEVEAWFKAQAELTDALLANIPGRDGLVEEWLALDKLQPAEDSAITYKQGRVFYKKVLSGENVGKLYFREGWEGEERLLFDPATYKAGVTTTIGRVVPSWDGQHIAIGFSSGGGEYSEIRVLEVDGRYLLPECIYPSLMPLAWTNDSRAFFYDAGKVTNVKSMEVQLNRKTRLHKLGTDTSTDIDVFSNESQPELGITAKERAVAFIDDSNPAYLIGVAASAQKELRVFYAPISGLNEERIKWEVLCKPPDCLVFPIVWGGKIFVFDRNHVYAVTHRDAPNYKVVRTSMQHPDWGDAETIIPEVTA